MCTVQKSYIVAFKCHPPLSHYAVKVHGNAYNTDFFNITQSGGGSSNIQILISSACKFLNFIADNFKMKSFRYSGFKTAVSHFKKQDILYLIFKKSEIREVSRT